MIDKVSAFVNAEGAKCVFKIRSEIMEYSLIMMKSRLEEILNTVYPKTGQKVHSTIILTDKFESENSKVYTNEVCPLNAYQDMRRDLDPELPRPSKIWVNYSPCPYCVKALIEEYEKSDKPEISIAKVYTGSQAVKSLQCLARLEHLGFRLTLWDFFTFNETSTSVLTCKDEINERFEDAKFMAEYMKTKNLLEIVRQISTSPSAPSWCEDLGNNDCPT